MKVYQFKLLKSITREWDSTLNTTNLYKTPLAAVNAVLKTNKFYDWADDIYCSMDNERNVPHYNSEYGGGRECSVYEDYDGFAAAHEAGEDLSHNKLICDLRDLIESIAESVKNGVGDVGEFYDCFDDDFSLVVKEMKVDD